MRRFLAWVIPRLPPPRVIHVEGDSYLVRWYLFGRLLRKYFPEVRPKLEALPLTGYLHRFDRPDRDRDLHCHPWKFSVSLILSGGYVEERLVGDKVVLKTYRPGSINILRADTFHRIAETLPGTHTLFFAGPKVQGWGFRLRDTGEFIPAERYFSRESDK